MGHHGPKGRVGFDSPSTAQAVLSRMGGFATVGGARVALFVPGMGWGGPGAAAFAASPPPPPPKPVVDASLIAFIGAALPVRGRAQGIGGERGLGGGKCACVVPAQKAPADDVAEVAESFHTNGFYTVADLLGMEDPSEVMVWWCLVFFLVCAAHSVHACESG